LVVSDTTADRTSIPAVTASSSISFPTIETATLDNGLKLVVATRGTIPLVDVSIQIDTGSTAQAANTPGTAAFVFGLLEKGTHTYDANELAAAKDKIGMQGSPGAGLERSSFDYQILRSHLGTSLELAAEILRNPTFPEEELQKEKAKIEAYLANLKHVPASAARSLFNRAVYGLHHPLGTVWSPELLSQASRGNLEEFHRREVTPANMTVFMIGDIGILEATAVVEKAFRKWCAADASTPHSIGAAEPRRARVILVDYPGAESSTIIAGQAIKPFDTATWTEISVMNRAFGGGFESRLNMNLREDKGWSYGYRSSISLNASGDMTLASSGQVQTDKTAASMREIMREFREFISTRPATVTEVDRIKLNRARSLPGSYSTNRGFLASIISSDGFGLPFDYGESKAERIAAVTLEGVNSRAMAMFDPDALMWLIVGDLALVEQSVRDLGFGDVEVWDPYGNKLR
jgi:zinc protease